MATTDGDENSARAELVVRAWELATGNGPTGAPMSTRAVAAELGISQASASRYIRLAERNVPWIDLLDTAENRLAQATRLDKYLRWIDEEAARRDQAAGDDGADKTDLIPIALKVEERWAKLGRLDPPTQVETATGPGTWHQPDPVIAAAIRDGMEIRAREQRVINGDVLDAPAGNDDDTTTEEST